MRLIDADVLIASMGKRYKEKCDIVPDNLAEGFVQMEKLIKEQPTAYDVDKVLKELESEAKRWEESGIQYEDKKELGVAEGHRRAAEIVKAERKG